jgi:hypothetical protein
MQPQCLVAGGQVRRLDHLTDLRERHLQIAEPTVTDAVMTKASTLR